ncbi:hypothetical protein [Brachybacterium sp. UNK5269]|uniref:hypothetical protein n=1 Tax=Brachybacterium sp. UNK5269 TaxID=3408576 RepID=UPI003BAEDE70
MARSEERLLEELRALREEVAPELHERLDGLDPAGAGLRAVRLARRVGRRAWQQGRQVLPPRSRD